MSGRAFITFAGLAIGAAFAESAQAAAASATASLSGSTELRFCTTDAGGNETCTPGGEPHEEQGGFGA
jgi:hypothetical protein